MRNRVALGVLCWATLACTMMGLGNLIRGGPWQVHLVVMPLLITAAMWLVTAWWGRFRALGAVVALLVGAVTWVCYLCGVAAGSPLPTPATVAAVLDQLGEAMVELPNYGRPANNAELFLPLGLVGLGPVCVLADLLALGLRRPVWMGVPVAACWAVFLTGSPGRSTGWILASGAAYLLLVAVAPRNGRSAGRFQLVALPLAAVAALLGLLASVVSPLTPGWGQSSQWLNFWNRNNSDLTGLSLEGPINVGDALRVNSEVELFRTQGEYTSPLQIEALDTFNGQTWTFIDTQSSIYRSGNLTGDTRVRWEHFRDGSSIAYLETFPVTYWDPGPDVEVLVTGLSGRYLPTGVGPRSVSGTRNMRLFYDWSTDSIRASRNLDSSDGYTAGTWVLDRSALRYGPSWSPGAVGTPDAASRSLPSLDRIRDLTMRVIGDATSQDERLQAIQAYLRGREFTYTLAPNWRGGDDPIWEFLDNKQGYCVHFASAMAAMGWSIGIPMRVAVGYLPGRLDDDGWRTVTGAQAHMWPQAFYEDIGWVSYEPTPAIGTTVLQGVAPSVEVPTDGPTASGEETEDVSETDDPTAVATTGPTGPAQSAWQQVWPWLAGVGGSVVGALLIVLLVWVVHMNRYAPERAWRVIRRRGAAAGLLTDGMSLRAATAALNGKLDAATGQGLAALRDNLELSRYAPPGSAPDRIPGRRLWDLKTAVVRSLRAIKK